MIIYPQALVLSAPITLKNSRIGWQTYTRGGLPSAVTVSTETTEGPKDAPLRSDTAEYWLASAMPATYQYDTGAMRDIDYIALGAHTCGSVGATVTAHTSTDGSVWTAFGGSVFQTDDAPIMFIDEVRSTRHVRVTFTGATPPRLGVLYTGKLLAMMRGCFVGHKPINLSRVTELRTTMSEGGHFLGQSYKRMGMRTSVTFQNLTGAWYRSDFESFVKAARKYPYFWAWRPYDFPNDVGYVWTREDISPTNERGGRMTVSWSMEGIGHE